MMLSFLIGVCSTMNSMEMESIIDPTILARQTAAFADRYKCSFCHEPFANSGVLNRHLISNHVFSESSHQCFHEDCDFSSPQWNTGLRKHHVSKHQSALLECSTCKELYETKATHIKSILKSLKDSSITQEVRWMKISLIIGQMKFITDRQDTKQKDRHNRYAKKIQCPKCSRYYDGVQALAKHDAEHVDLDAKVTYICGHDQCKNRFMTFMRYKTHHKSQHKIVAAECSSCKEQFLNHQRRHTESIQINNYFTVPDLGDPKALEENRYRCQNCGKSTQTFCDLQDHIINAHLLPAYSHKCFHENCNFFTSNWIGGLSHHHNKKTGHHGAETLTNCRICKTPYQEKKSKLAELLDFYFDNSLDDETKRRNIDACIGQLKYLHEGKTKQKQAMVLSNALACPMCPKKYSGNDSLNAHINNHIDEAAQVNFICCHTAMCQMEQYKTFKRYTDHHRTHHNGTASKCDKCQIQYAVNYALHNKLIGDFKQATDSAAVDPDVNEEIESLSLVEELAIFTEKDSLFDHVAKKQRLDTEF